MSDVMILKQIVRDGLAVAHEAMGDILQKPGYGYDPYEGYLGFTPEAFLANCFDFGNMSPDNFDSTEGPTPEGWVRLEELFFCTVQYRRDSVFMPHPNNVRSDKEMAPVWRLYETRDGKGKYYFPYSFYYEGKPYALKEFVDGTPLPWDHQGKVCTQSAHFTNPVATLENALNKADFKRKEEVMRKFNSFSSALMKSDFIPPWDRSAKR